MILPYHFKIRVCKLCNTTGGEGGGVARYQYSCHAGNTVNIEVHCAGPCQLSLPTGYQRGTVTL